MQAPGYCGLSIVIFFKGIMEDMKTGFVEVWISTYISNAASLIMAVYFQDKLPKFT